MTTRIALLLALILAGGTGSDGPVPSGSTIDVAGPKAAASSRLNADFITMGAAAMTAAPRYVRDDLTGDGRSDLLLLPLNGSVLPVWSMVGNRVDKDERIGGSIDCFIGHRMVTGGDFNGDRGGDLLHVSDETGSVCISLGGNSFNTIGINSAGVKSAVVAGFHAPGWKPVATGDVDGDGKSDIVLVNRSARLVAYWRMDGASVVGYSPTFRWPDAANNLSVTGDFNGDRQLDLIWSDGTIWTGSSGAFQASRPSDVVLPAHWKIVGAGDVDGDGRDDLLLENSYDGFFAYWLMDGARIRSKSIAFAAPSGHRLATHGDYEGDGKLDVVWVHSAKRIVTMWLGDGFGFREALVKGYSFGYRLDGIERRPHTRGDVQGKGTSALLLFNDDFGVFSYWNMMGNKASPAAAPPFKQPAGSRLVATGDLNGDGSMDLVWTRDSDRQILVSMFADAGTIETVESIALAPGWKVEAAADLDGDGRHDLLVRNDGEQRCAYWLMDGPVPVWFSHVYTCAPPTVTTATLSKDGTQGAIFVRSDASVVYADYIGGHDSHVIGTPAEGWRVAGAADMDGDHLTDLVLENQEGIAFWIKGLKGVRRYSPGFLRPAGFRLATIGDYDSDGKGDIVWLRETDGTLLLWTGNGEGFDQRQIDVAVAPGYRIVQP